MINCKTLYTSSSNISGVGTFSSIEIHSGSVLEYDTSFWESINFHDVDKIEDLNWMGVTDEKAKIIPEGSFLRYMNHSDTPNLTWNPKLCIFVSSYFIPKHTELTYDYNLEIAPSFIKENKPNWIK